MRFFVVFLCFLLISCGPNTVSTDEELQAYILDEDNGLVKKWNDGDLNVDIILRPSESLVAQEIGKGRPDTTTVSRLRKKYSKNLYFMMSVSKGDAEALHSLDGFGEYSEVLQVLSFRMNEFVRLTTSENDTIPVADFLLNRTYGLTRSTDILFVFSNEKIKDDRWIQFEFNEFGLKTGIQKFRFNTADIYAAPTILH